LNFIPQCNNKNQQSTNGKHKKQANRYKRKIYRAHDKENVVHLEKSTGKKKQNRTTSHPSDRALNCLVNLTYLAEGFMFWWE
jgi:hypothetical protein